MSTPPPPVPREPRPPILDVEDLAVSFNYGGTWTKVVRSATFSVQRGEIVGLVGESGSGKTVTAMATMGLAPPLGGRISGGAIRLDGQDVTTLAERQWAALRGDRISMIFQQPIRTLNPAFTVGEQIAESLRRHKHLSRKDAWDRSVELLDRVHIDKPAQRARQYPHELSGGMCQRVMISIALACDPEILIADEPTTALDVTVQRRILELLQEIRDETGIGILFITHDLGVIAQMCDRVAVMYAGEVVEQAHVLDLFKNPRHPYTHGLLNSLPRLGQRFGSIPGRVPMPAAMPSGCRFHPRCPHVVEELCVKEPPELREVASGHQSRCVRSEDLSMHVEVRMLDQDERPSPGGRA